jgi:hypothetical protein
VELVVETERINEFGRWYRLFNFDRPWRSTPLRLSLSSLPVEDEHGR